MEINVHFWGNFRLKIKYNTSNQLAIFRALWWYILRFCRMRKLNISTNIWRWFYIASKLQNILPLVQNQGIIYIQRPNNLYYTFTGMWFFGIQLFTFSLPIYIGRESIVFVKKFELQILMNVDVSWPPEPKKVISPKCLCVCMSVCMYVTEPTAQLLNRLS